jgi:hypothetical protein
MCGNTSETIKSPVLWQSLSTDALSVAPAGIYVTDDWGYYYYTDCGPGRHLMK